jgi:transcriptional regulator with AAA-type ATPase domain
MPLDLDARTVIRDLLQNQYNETPVPDIFLTEDQNSKISTPEANEIIIQEDTVRNIEQADVGYNTLDITVTIILEIKSREGNTREIKNEVQRILMDNRTSVRGLDGGYDRIEPPQEEIKDPAIREGQTTITVDLVKYNAEADSVFN